MPHSESNLTEALLAGGMAGTIVDLVLFPLDTLKTRLQSEKGLWKSGGYRGIYSGVVPAALGSAPTAALFFFTYELIKPIGYQYKFIPYSVVHMAAASVGEVAACLIRVPVEVIKQRSQASPGESSLKIFKRTLTSEGIFGFYRGYWSTVVREIPFSLLQFPIWEYIKKEWAIYQNRSIQPWQSAVSGAVAGAISAMLTTPLDVVKTRIILSEKGSVTAQGSVGKVICQVYAEKGIRGLFVGVVPRVLWISLGGFIFLGSYEQVKQLLEKFNKSQ